MNPIELSKEFPRESVHWRVQGKPYERNGQHSAMALAYIDARDVMDRLDVACGPAGWQDKYEVTPTGLIICSIGIEVNGCWVWKSDGAGETAVEGKKGGMSDALKRAAVKWGIGRYLYRLDSPWVKCEVRSGKNNTVAWKSWSEDPWSKVTVTTYNAAEEAQEKAAFEVSVEGAIKAISLEEDLDGLRSFFTDLGQTRRDVASDTRVLAAKDKRKAELAA